MRKSGDYLIELKKEKNPLFKQVCIFNCRPATYAHASHWPVQLQPAHLNGLLKSSTGQARLSQWLLGKCKIEGTFVDDFESPLWRWVLLDASSIQRLFLYTGAAFFYERIGREIVKERLQALRSQLGEEIYSFALRRASLMVGDRPAIPILSATTDDLFSDTLFAAQQCFSWSLSEASLALKARLALKLPAALQWEWIAAPTPEDASAARHFLKRLLIREVLTEDSSCFF